MTRPVSKALAPNAEHVLRLVADQATGTLRGAAIALCAVEGLEELLRLHAYVEHAIDLHEASFMPHPASCKSCKLIARLRPPGRGGAAGESTGGRGPSGRETT